MTEEQREKIAEQTGFPFERILSSVRAQERHIDVTRRQSVEAKTNVREAIEDLIDRDPQAGKLKKHIREYFDDLPLDVRADPSAVARHMKKAVTYAKGAVGVPAASGGSRRPDPRTPGPDDEPEFDPESGEDPKPGTKATLDTGLKITIGESPKGWEKNQQGEHGVRIVDDNEEPEFR